MVIDSHCHLDLLAKKKDINQVLLEAAKAQVAAIVVPGINEQNWLAINKLASEHATVYFALGFHPLFLEEVDDGSIARLEQRVAELKNNQKFVALGECGLDFYQGRENELLQKSLLSEQIRIANQYQLPIILHCRKAHQDLIALLKQNPPLYSGVIHGFSGSYQQAMDYVTLGLKIGVGGVITYERAQKTRSTIINLPLESLLLETDAPDMPLYGYQGQPNEPKMVNMVLSSLNMLRSENEQTVTSQLLENSKLTFNFCD